MISGSFSGSVYVSGLDNTWGNQINVHVNGDPVVLKTYNAYSHWRIGVRSGSICNNLVIGIMIADNVDVWEPYVGGIPSPNPDYPQEIQSVVNPKLRIVCGTKGALLTEVQYNTLTTTLKRYLDDRFEIYYIPENNQGFNNAVIIILSGEHFKNISPFGIVNTFNSASWITTLRNLGILLCSSTVDPKETIGYGIKQQTAILPYTLNSIPVSGGGNVTIDAQQYIADYVDVERKKLVKPLAKVRVTKNAKWSTDKIGTYRRFLGDGVVPNNEATAKGTNYTYLCTHFVPETPIQGYMGEINNAFYVRDYDDGKAGFNTDKFETLDEWYNFLDNNEVYVIYKLKTPTEIDLTDEEVQAFKDLCTYYPTTNVSVTSDQLDGYTTFNYPLNMANGWNYVMQQIEETRPIIYDTEVQVLENRIDTAILTAMMEG